mmetsp:Transcript_8659/g.15060  ORF Transcript_8659/g.15060 Transcript_8659/m.15060 type:complete len:122 (-) Transcript_8659:106-471(-)
MQPTCWFNIDPGQAAAIPRRRRYRLLTSSFDMLRRRGCIRPILLEQQEDELDCCERTASQASEIFSVVEVSLSPILLSKVEGIGRPASDTDGFVSSSIMSCNDMMEVGDDDVIGGQRPPSE